VKQAVGGAWYGSNQDYPLEKVVGDRFRAKKATLALAESCTGGLLASRLTDIPGSSDFLKEACVTYSNESKVRLLGVAEASLAKHGAVSKPVAIEMAQGIRSRAGTTFGVGITGIAGPGGGTAAKPVGLVYISVVTAQKTICQEHRFGGNRDIIRQRAVLAALDLLRALV
jgi:nicotinamide-nucleotide amidase